MNFSLRQPQLRARSASAFTLIELLITIGIVAILAAIAVPGYRSFVIRANRVEGIDAVLASMICQVRIYSRINVYDPTQCGAGLTANGLYDVTIDTADPFQTVTITATPQGRQVNDDCGVLTLNEKGMKSSSTASAEKCWAGRGQVSS
jgi:type IV pilus assembly protein PilE